MSYPYGPENYPTWESFEPYVDTMRITYGVEYERLQREVEFANANPELASKAQKFLASKTDSELQGLAFGVALEATDHECGYFMRDLFAILDDKVIGKINQHERDLEKLIETDRIIPDYHYRQLAEYTHFTITYGGAYDADGRIVREPYEARSNEFPDLTATGPTADKTREILSALLAERFRQLTEANDPRLKAMLPDDEIAYLRAHGYQPDDSGEAAPEDREHPAGKD